MHRGGDERVARAGRTPAMTLERDDTLPQGDERTITRDPEPGAVTSAIRPPLQAGRYRIEGELARGGLGKVLRARDPELGRLVALKVPLDPSEPVRRRFAREVQLTARLQHPSIVPVYEAGRLASGEPYYAMKLLEGRPFADLLGDARDLPARLALLPNLVAVADAVAYAHDHRVIHRDLKPSNVLVGKFGETVVLDWGLAKELDAADESGVSSASSGSALETVAGTVMGTPRYMSPEQAAGDAVDERADVYAIGAMLYHLLAGVAPHGGGSSTEVMTRLRDEAPRPLVELEPRVPRDLAAIVAKAMARRAADRYPSAAPLADDLRRFTTGQLVTSHAYSAWALLARFVRRHRAAVTAAALVVVALAVISAVAVQRIERARRQAERERDRLLLAHARTALVADPTAAIAWLTQYPLDGAQWREARGLISAAEAAGVAGTVLRHQTDAALAADGASVVVVTQRGTIERRDRASGRVRELVDAGTADVGIRLLPGGELVALSPDVAWRCSPDGSCAKVWHAAGGPPCGNFAVSRDARVLACGAAEQGVRLVDLDRGTDRFLAGPQGELDELEFSADGRWLAAGGADPAVFVWEVATGAGRRLDGHTGSVKAVGFTPDGRVLASAGQDGALHLWDVATGVGRTLPGHAGPVSALAVSPDGLRVATGGEDHAVRVWPIGEGAPVVLAGHADTVTSLAFSPDGHRLASGSEDHEVWLWSLDDGDAQVLRGHQGPVIALELDARGTTLLSRSFDSEIRLWDVTPETGTVLPAGAGRVNRVAFAGDGSLAYGTSDGGVRLCRAGGTTCDVLGQLPAAVVSVAFAADGAHVAAGADDGTLELWDLPSRASRTLAGHTTTVRQLAFAPDGAALYSASYDGTVRRWDPATGQGAVVIRHDDMVFALAVSPDGARVASGAFDHTVRVWDRATGEVTVLRGHPHWIAAVAVTPDGRVVSGGFDGSVRLWDRAGGAGRILYTHDDAVAALALSPDGRTVASASNDRTVRIWDLARDRGHALDGSSTRVRTLAFSPDGRQLATGDDTGMVRVWELATGEVRVVGAHRTIVRDLAFSPDGARLASGSNDHVGRVWTLADGTALPADPAGDRAVCARLTSATIGADGTLATR